MKVISDKEYDNLVQSLGARILYSNDSLGDAIIKGIYDVETEEIQTCPRLINLWLAQYKLENIYNRIYKLEQKINKKNFFGF